MNLAYVTALFPESEIVRQQLRERRPRLKTLMASLSIVEGEREEGPSSFSALLSTQTIVSHKLQILFLLMLVRPPVSSSVNRPSLPAGAHKADVYRREFIECCFY